jgi:hypothetical protein
MPLLRSRQVTLKNRRAQVLKLVGEAALIVVSVYVAIVLEGASADRAARRSALESLRTVQAELERDLDEARSYAEQKRDRSALFADLSRWLRSDAPSPTDSFAVTLEGVLTGNYTVFPRSAAWTTMVSQGQLAHLEDPQLVARLAELYEHWSDRVVYNGEGYDEAIWIVTRESVPLVWDRRTGGFVSTDRDSKRQLDEQLVHLEIWNDSYGRLLDRWADEIDQVLQQVTGRTEGGGT